MSAEVFVAQGAEVCRRNVENSLATGLAVSLHAESCAGVSHENARREFRVGIELEAVFDHVRVFLVHAGLAGTDHETTVSETAVVLVEFFFADEVDRGVVFIEVVRHRLDGVFDVCLIGTFFCNNVNKTSVLLTSREFRHGTATHGFESRFHRAGVLLGILHALDAANSIAVALRNTLAPERVVPPLPQNV